MLGSFALWTVVPFAWIQLTANLLSGQGARFVMVILGCPLLMGLTFVALGRVEAHRLTRLGHGPPEPVEEGEDPPVWRSTLMEASLAVGVAIAVIGMVLWWFVLADNPSPSGPLQPL